jgi:aspartyl-tRNA(Asn)/glutamyl-tRNA(Gln) amidotransferase subunit A
VSVPVDVLYLPALEQGRRIQRGELTSLALTEACLARIDALDPTLRAFVTVMRDAARAQAARADLETRAGKTRGPLHGVPWGAKDLLAARGAPTTWGARPFASQTFDEDAAVVQRLDEAGAVLLGKLAMVELAGGLGYTVPAASATGAARNPWDTTRWTCGSSSGAGGAVAAGLVGFAIGSETWGSILCPASFNGITGLRPTFGRVSRRGAMALSWTMDKIGPMARTAADCEAVLQAIAGHDARDHDSAEEPPPTPLAESAARGMRALFIDEPKSAEPGVKAAVAAAADVLRASGVLVETGVLPALPFEEAASLIITAEAATAFEDLARDGRVRQLVDAGAPLAFAIARAVTGADYVKASRIRTLCQRAMADIFSRYDVLIAASEGLTALPAEQSFADADWSDPVGGVGNLCGLPAVSVPCGFGKDGLPVGLQIMAGAFDEPKAIAVARLYQSRTDWHTRRPTGI